MFQQIQQNKRGLTGTLLLSLLLISFAVSIISASAVSLDYYGWDIINPPAGDDYSITLITNGTYVENVAVTYPTPGLVTGYNWTYDVWLADASNPHTYDISHWILAFCGGEASILGASHAFTYGQDASGTGVYGIKFDESVTKGSTVTFWFILDGDYSQGEVPVALKPDAFFLHGTIIGPLALADLFTVDLETVDVPQDDSPPWIGHRMKVTATAATVDPPIVKVIFKWYGPFTPGDTPWADPSKYVVTTENTTGNPFESWYRVPASGNPNGLLHEDDLGGWFVEAEFYALISTNFYLKGYASDSLDISGVPWFTSLPIAILATVGVVFVLKRKGNMSLPV